MTCKLAVYLTQTDIHYTTHTLHYSTLKYTTVQLTTVHYNTVHYTTIHYTTLHYSTVHYTTLHYITLHNDIPECSNAVINVQYDTEMTSAELEQIL